MKQILLFLFNVMVIFFLCCSCTGTPRSREIYIKRGLYFQQRLVNELFKGLEKDKAPLHDTRDWKHSSLISAAWFGFDPYDSTTILTKALNSGARFILIPDLGKPWITEPLFIKSNTTLIIESGVEIQAKRGAFHGGGDTLLSLKDVENVTIYGYGARLKMFKEDYRKAPYKKAQWRHTIQIKGGRSIHIFGITAESSGGDGIYLGSGQRGYNENIIIKDVTLRYHYRQGISVISAQDLLIENTEMSFTEGHSPAAGIDFEPNRPAERLINCRLKHCSIHNNKGPGILICLKAQDMTTLPFDISFFNCIVKHQLIAITLLGEKKISGGRLFLQNTKLSGLSFLPGIETITIVKD
jgi:hypothetical protein